ncbi:hypothetical protein RJ641_003532 [Dillenia turbinata]|uniref:J domain-containing protein n=1 Tax=Dillenia turbinata TaxID=194707 RepID=A0AAN8Z9H3_9MAGN
MASTCLPLYTPTPSIPTRATKLTFPGSRSTSLNGTTPNSNSLRSRATASTSSSSVMDFDLYDLLGIDSTSNLSQIKMAYRLLQKRCHPDIAGPAGHDMAIVLNEAYAKKIAELRGYSGKPIYSVWFGGESEERAVFVDEVKCVGCLKCALFAEKTFAIESLYGRARVVAQWADPEHKIHQAIQACPVDCISIVERSDLAALEFLMSKQPRGNVRLTGGNTAGTRVSDIFNDVKKFQTKYRSAAAKSSGVGSKESARISAIQAIRSISNWLYWQPPMAMAGAPTSDRLIHAPYKTKQPNINIDKLREAAAARKLAKPKRANNPSLSIYSEEYWIPTNLILPEPSPPAQKVLNQNPTKETKEKGAVVGGQEKQVRTAKWGIPESVGALASLAVWFGASGEGKLGRLKEHIGGSLALDIVNSNWLQIILAGITWYLIATAVLEIVEALRTQGK